MGHTDHERRRLSLQARALNPLTQEFLGRAGITAGMRVLDLGCGVGEVSAIAASLVGSSGSVTGVDFDAGALALAEEHARLAGLDHVRFVQGNVGEFAEGAPYDAVVGRLILIHVPDAYALVKHAASLVRSGGTVAFQDYDLSRSFPSFPQKPLRDRFTSYFVELFTRATAAADVGMRISYYLVNAGLEAPQCRAEILMEGGSDSIFYEWIAETVRGLAPKLEALGIVTAAELDLDTLADRLRQEAIEIGGCVSGPIMVSAAARKP